MDANGVKEILSENDIISLLEDLGAEPQPQGSNIVCKTVCHHGHKHKLIFFGDSKTFRCFTDQCGTMDIFGLVSRVMELDFYNSFKYVCLKFGISYQGETYNTERVDMSFFQKFKRQNEKIIINPLNKTILNTYSDLYHRLWINDGISIQSMKKFGVKFSILNNQIIIPHFDLNGNLIGVRARNLNEAAIEEGKKYMPVFHKDKFLKHPTGSALYGLNFTKEHIKKYRRIILFESEKSVMQLDTMFPEMSIGVAISGSSLTSYQINILRDLNVRDVVIALDKEYEEIVSTEFKFYQEKINRVFVDKLVADFNLSVIWDEKGLLDLKDSPTDKGVKVFNELFESRAIITPK